jgi:hypothetical protein
MMINRINKKDVVDNDDMGDDALMSEAEEGQFLCDLEGPEVRRVEIPTASRCLAPTVDPACRTPRSASERTLELRHDLQKAHDDEDGSSQPLTDLDWSIDDNEGNDEADAAAAEQIPNTDKCVDQYNRAPRLTLSQEVRKRRRQRLLNSRFMRGFVLLCVYAGLVLQPSLTTNTAHTVTSEPLDNSPVALSATPEVNHTIPIAAKTRSSPLANLPRFHHHTTPFHSTIPPNSSTSVHWHKIPPNPPRVYHKKQRPILSHAHSYQLHQEPLVFGRELKTSFLVDSSDFDDRDGPMITTMIVPSRYNWGTSLIWLSLLCLLCDTCYREWQHYRWHRQYQRRSASQRSIHRRRSPSPVPSSSNNINSRRSRQQLRRPSRPRFVSL